MFAWRTIKMTAAALTLLLAASTLAAQPAATKPVPATQPAAGPAPTTQPAATKPAPEPASAPVKPAEPVPTVAAKPEPKPGKGAEGADVRFQFDDASYRDVVKWLAQRVVKKPILGDLNALSGKLTYFDAVPYTRAEAVDIVNAVLRMKGYTLMDHGRYLKLVQLAKIGQDPTLPIIQKGQFEVPRRPGEEIVTAVIPLTYIDANQASAIIARMVSSFGALSVLGQGQGIIITDTVSNIRRIHRLLQAVDTGEAAKQEMKLYPLKLAAAGQVAKLIEQLFGAAQRSSRRFRYNRQTRRYDQMPADPTRAASVTPDERTNTVIVVASPERHKMIEEFLVKIDVPETETGAIRTFVLKNAKAEDIAKTVTAAVGTKSITVPGARGRTTIRKVPIALIVPDATTNRLLVSAGADVMKRIEKLIKELDNAVAAGAGLRIFPLKVANAAGLAQVLQNTFSRRDPRGRTRQTLSVVADTRTNSLIVRGPAADMEEIAKLIEMLDKDTPTKREYHVVRLPAGDARQVAQSLSRLLAQGRRGKPADDSIRIEAETGTNSLLIAAAPGDWQRIDAVLKQLTKEVQTDVVSVRVFTLKHSRAAELAPALSRVFQPRRAKPGRRGTQPTPAVITHDAVTNTIMASATAEDLAEMERLIKVLDVPGAKPGQIQVRTYALTNASAAALARSLTNLFSIQAPPGRGRRGQQPRTDEPQPKFEAEQSSNQLVVAATEEQFKVIDELVQRVQEKALDSQSIVRLFSLQHAQADQLAPALTRVVQAEIAAMQRRGATRGRRSDFQISVDKRTNSLLVTAPSETMKIIEELMPMLDAEGVATETTKVVELKNADPRELADALNAALGGRSAAPAPSPRRRGRGPRGPDLSGMSGRRVLVVPEPSARAVLLTGTTEDVAFAEKLIQQIDARPAGDKLQVKTFALKHGQADDVARVLKEAFGQLGRGRPGRPAAGVRISADRNANTLVVSASGEVMERIEEVLKEIDVEGADEGAITIEIVPLTNAKADQLATAMNAAQGMPGQRRGRRTAADETVRVTADAASNSLLLTGRPAQIAEAKKLIQQLDEAAVKLTSETRVFILKQAKAAEVAPVLEKILIGQAAGRFRRRGPGPAPVVTGAPDIRIAAQESANAIVVSGPPETIALAGELIKEFDGKDPPPGIVVEIVKLTKADASSLADAVNKVLAEQAAAAPQRRGRFRQPAAAKPVGALVVPEVNSNSVLVRGLKLDVERAVALIRLLDEGGTPMGTTVRTYPLKLADASEVAKTIDVLFRQIIRDQQRRKGRQPVFSIAADYRTNTVIVSADAANLAAVEALLKTLDADADVARREVRYIPLFAADPLDVVDHVEALFAERKKGDRPTVTADVLSSGLTVVCRDTDFGMIETVVAELDERAEPSYTSVRVISLGRQMDAEKLAEALKRVYEQVSGEEVKITDKLPTLPKDADVLILPAPAGPAGTATVAPRTAPAAGAKPAALAPKLPPAKPPIIIAVDKRSNLLIISAGRDEADEIEALIQQLTGSEMAGEEELKVFKLKNADPAGVAKTISALFIPKQPARRQPRQQQQPRGRRGQQQQPQRRQPQAQAAKPTVAIVADVRTRSLIVRAKPAEMALIEQLIKQLDDADTVISEVRIFVLKNADANEVAANINALFGRATPRMPRGRNAPKPEELIKQMLQMQQAGALSQVDASMGVTVSANRATNSVIVAAPAEAMELIANLIEQLDQAPAIAAVAVRMFPIENASIPDLVDSLTKIFSGRRAPGGAAARGRGRQAQAGGGSVTIAGNEAAGMIIVSAQVDQLALVEEVIKELDQPGVGDATTVKVYPIRDGDAQSIAQALSQMMLQSAASAPRGRGRGRAPAPASSSSLRISAEAASNAIVVRASQQDHEKIALLIRDLDKGGVAQFKTIRLDRADARETSQALNALLRAWPRKSNEPRPRVAFDTKTNTLMVSGNESQMAAIEKIVADLEAGPKEEVKVRLLPLANAIAGDVSLALERFYGPRAAGADAESRSVTIATDARTNTLIVSAKPEQFADITALVAKLDEAGTGSQAGVIRVYQLVEGDAVGIANALTKTLTQQTAAAAGPGARGRGRVAAGGGPQQVYIAAEPGSNVIVVRAPKADHERIATLIGDMDKPAQATAASFRTFKLVHADASAMVNALNRMLWAWPRKQGEPRPTVAADNNTNTLMVSGTAKQIEAVAKMIAEIDEGKTEKVDVQLVTLNHARASEIAQALRPFYGPGARTARDPKDKTVTITPDDRSNILLIAAAPKQMVAISALIGKLDMADVVGDMQRVIIPLTYAPAASVASAITRNFAPQRGQRVPPSDLVVATGEPSTNVLMVSASAKNLEKIRLLVKEMDTKGAGGRTVEFMLLENAKAADLAKVLSQVFRATGGARGPGRGAVGEEPPTISAATECNALIMAGKKADLETLMTMAKQLDQAVIGKATQVRILPLKNADAVAVANMVSQIYRQTQQAARRDRRAVDPVAISADAQTNALIVAANEEDFRAISKLVNEIDEMGRGTTLRLIQLKNANPDEVLKALNQIFGSGGTGRVTRGRTTGRGRQPAAGSGSSRLQASVLTDQRALLISASDEDWAVIQKIVESLEKAAEKTKPEVLVFPLSQAPNTQVAQALNTLYSRSQRPGHPEDRVTVTPLAGTNAIVVIAVAEKMKEVGELIKQLDGVKIAGKLDYRVFPLVNSQATKLLPMLQQLIRPLIKATPNQEINLTADPRSNTIVAATQAPAVMDEIARIIKTLDAVPPFKSADVIIIPLKNAEAPTLAAVLTEMLTPGANQALTPEARALQEQVRLLRMQQGHEKLPLLDLSKPIKVTSDPPQRGQAGSNSLIISSTPENLQAMAEVVLLLDKMPVGEGVKLQVVHLKNADALAVMQLLREIFTQGRQLAGTPATPMEGKAKPETMIGAALTEGLNVSADARTNALVIAGSVKAVALARLIVKDLDRQAPSQFTEVKVFKLVHADADRLATMIRAVFAEQPTLVPGVAGARAYVTKLRMLRQKAKPVTAKVARSHATVVVQGDRNANLLVVAARSDILPVVAELVHAADIPQAGSMSVIRIYTLDNADASRMSSVITGLYTGANANLIRPEDRPTITVDTRTNSMIVSSSEKTFLVIDAMLRKLDAKLPIDLRDIRLLPLKNADAITLAPIIQQMMDARVQRQQSLGVKDAEALRMILVPDARSNAIIVGGSAEGYKLVADLAKQLDEASPALSGQIQLISLTNANAGTLGATLTNLFNQRYAAARTPDVQRLKPIILPDLRTNLLLIAANADDSKIIQNLVKTLDLRPADPAVELVVIPMKHNDAGSVGPVIQRIFADRLQAMTPPGQQVAPQDVVSVEVDPLSNALIVSASKENLAMIRTLLAKVDVEPPTDTGVVRMYPLQNADVSRVAGMLQSLISQGLYKPALITAADNAIAQAREKVAITTDVRTNVLIISASKENFAVIEQILKQVDVKEGWGLAGRIKLYLLKHADANQLGTTLQQMFDRKRAAETATGAQARSLPVVIIPDERTNTLLVAGSKEHTNELDVLVAKLDVADVIPSYEFRIFYLKQASAVSIEPTLRQLFANRVRRGIPPAPVTIIADPNLNALIIGASRDDLLVADRLIQQIDQAKVVPGQVIQAFPVTKADAGQLAQTLQEMYDAAKPTGGQSSISVSVDERSNTILVTAAPGDMPRVAELIKKLDTAPVTDVTEIRIFSLRHADAAQLATILTDALTNKPTPMTAVSPNRATLLRFVARQLDGKPEVASALKQGVMITAVPRTNSLLVQAPVEAMGLLAKLIDSLDNTDPRRAEIRVFTLTNADATQMATVLQELFQLQVANTARQAARYTVVASPAGAGEAVAADMAATATLGSAEQTALTVTVDRRTNSLLVGGTKEYIELVGRVIQDLDASPAEDRETVVYRLKNAQATDIEAALRQFLDQERQRIVSTLGADAVGAAKELLAKEIAIVAEPISNTLLISGSPRVMDTIAAMVRELDQPPPQVLVQVLLAEVSLDDETEFGIEWSAISHPGETRTVSGQTAFGVMGEGGGFTFAVSSGDFSFLLRAMQVQQRLEVLSRPQILASDNQNARISIGQRVPYVSSSFTTTAGTLQNTLDYEDVGIILDITPRISPGGFVTMLVSTEISSLDESTVEISENLNAVIINSREADTTVTVRDGHTIVIGGLITNSILNREEKVPLLGDLPLIGALFKNTRAVKERRELLIILTPKILRTPSDADVLSNRHIRKLSLSKAIHTDKYIGEVLNPLRNVTPLEIRQLEGVDLKPLPDTEPVVIPLMLPREPRKRRTLQPLEGKK